MANTDQQRALDLIEQGKNVFISGKAGVGKSWLIREIRNRFLDVEVTASTGRAANEIDGETIHRWSGLGMESKNPSGIARKILNLPSMLDTKIKQQTTRILIIDEISMITNELLDCLDILLRTVRSDPAPFGGIQMVLVGDLLQLPPIGKDCSYMFDSDAWKDGGFTTINLSIDVRHKDDQTYTRFLEKLRFGTMDDEMVELLKPCRHRKFDDGIEPIEIYSTRKGVDRANKKKMDGLGEVEQEEYKAEDKGALDELKDVMAPPVLTLKVGCSVMLVKNLDVRSGLANGTLGRVEGFSATTRFPIVRFTSSVQIIVPATFERKGTKQDTILASRKQIPLIVSYAMTAHKAQGLTLDRVSVTLTDAFADSQVYVILSRVKTMEGLRIQDSVIHKSKVKASRKAIEFYRNLDEEKEKGEEQLSKRVKVE